MNSYPPPTTPILRQLPPGVRILREKVRRTAEIVEINDLIIRIQGVIEEIRKTSFQSGPELYYPRLGITPEEGQSGIWITGEGRKSLLIRDFQALEEKLKEIRTSLTVSLMAIEVNKEQLT